MLACDAPKRLTMLECRFNKTTHHPSGAASASVAVSTHSWGPPYPRAARTLFLTPLLACHVFVFPADSG
jgi:hypothetical protein